MPLLSLVPSRLPRRGRPRADKCPCQTAQGEGRAGTPHTPPSGAAAGVGKARRLLPYVRALLSPRLGRGRLVLLAASVHVRQLPEPGPPVVQVSVVLVPGAGRVQGADGARGGPAALVVEDQQRVIGRCRGVVVGCAESLGAVETRVRVQGRGQRGAQERSWGGRLGRRSDGAWYAAGAQ